MRLALFAAFPQEIKPIIKYFRAAKEAKTNPFKIFLTESSSYEIIVILTGVGVSNAEAAMKFVLEKYKPDSIISIGFCGALYKGAGIGDLIWASRVMLISQDKNHTLEIQDSGKLLKVLCEQVPIKAGSVLSLERWMKKTEINQTLTGELSFPVCDMETYPLAHLSIKRGLPFIVIRAVTDTADEDIPFNPYEVCDTSGAFRISKVLGLLLRKPTLIPEIIRLGRNSKSASLTLCRAVQTLIEIL
jgi:adenosylhomocysteine nucleosidase